MPAKHIGKNIHTQSLYRKEKESETLTTTTTVLLQEQKCLSSRFSKYGILNPLNHFSNARTMNGPFKKKNNREKLVAKKLSPTVFIIIKPSKFEKLRISSIHPKSKTFLFTRAIIYKQFP